MSLPPENMQDVREGAGGLHVCGLSVSGQQIQCQFSLLVHHDKRRCCCNNLSGFQVNCILSVCLHVTGKEMCPIPSTQTQHLLKEIRKATLGQITGLVDVVDMLLIRTTRVQNPEYSKWKL